MPVGAKPSPLHTSPARDLRRMPPPPVVQADEDLHDWFYEKVGSKAQSNSQAERVRRSLADIDAELGRSSTAIASGGEVPTLLQARQLDSPSAAYLTTGA